MKSGDEPVVIFIPDYGLIRVRSRDFRQEPDPSKVSRWVSEEAGLNALSQLKPEDVMKRKVLPYAQVVPMSVGLKQQLDYEVFLKLLSAYKNSISDREKAVFYAEPWTGTKKA